jgi:16S rRNA (cytidine1402-2'-O)-methyltransferase
MPGTLYVVATPIGNLEDITLRALRVLREADLVAAEDTRRTARLLGHHGLTTSTLSFYEHNMATRLPQLVARLQAGGRIALVSDAGTPGISDPGSRLVQRCRDLSIPVTVVPGASAPLAAAVASGFPLVPLTIYGFAPARSNDRRKWLEAVASVPHTLTFFESPHRIRKTLSDLMDVLGNRPIAVGRELTKVFEQVIQGTPEEVAGRLEQARGEFTVVLGPAAPDDGRESLVDDQGVAAAFGRLSESMDSTRRQKIAAVARKLGMSTRDVYAAIERTRREADG